MAWERKQATTGVARQLDGEGLGPAKTIRTFLHQRTRPCACVGLPFRTGLSLLAHTVKQPPVSRSLWWVSHHRQQPAGQRTTRKC